MASESGLPPNVLYHLERRADELFFRSQAEEALRRIPREASPVLDLACGTAPLAISLLPRGQEYIGVDSDPAMVDGAIRRLAGEAGRVVLADARRLPFADGSLGAVASLGLFEYLEDPVSVLKEIRRVLPPGGVAILTVPRRDAPYRRAQAIAAPLLRALGRSDPFDLQSGRDVTACLMRSWMLDVDLELEAEAYVAPGVLPWPIDRLLPGLADKLAAKAGPRFGTARLFVLRATR